ncbi:uncharacterized protein G2W53_004996 [Senna tora]|uniref:Uncharacterized protein n=1 Tax=Senna tora TaxID=362788 RepID=A0A834XG96_9FABA|nr:uncharacterized protein G2W53_004996 [Senna tora]
MEDSRGVGCVVTTGKAKVDFNVVATSGEEKPDTIVEVGEERACMVDKKVVFSLGIVEEHSRGEEDDEEVGGRNANRGFADAFRLAIVGEEDRGCVAAEQA